MWIQTPNAHYGSPSPPSQVAGFVAGSVVGRSAATTRDTGKSTAAVNSHRVIVTTCSRENATLSNWIDLPFGPWPTNAAGECA